MAFKDKNGKYNLTDKLGPNEDCILILDRTNFYPESGGQQSDKGKIVLNTNDGLGVNIDHVAHIKGFSFHCGKSIELTNLSLNETVFCQVDKNLRYQTTLNHTAVHILNDSIRKHFKSENSILQTNSVVKNDSFKFEFKFNEMLIKPTIKDLEKIQLICNDTIKKSIPVYIEDDVQIDDQPARKLSDILYPSKVRVVNVGSKLDSGHSAELCCGSHASNTGQLEQIFLTKFNIIGDSSFEIEGCTSQSASETEQNDKQVLEYMNEMIQVYKNKTENESKMSNIEIHSSLNQLADKSIKIESIFKSKPTSYLTLQHVKSESIKYRPSKHVLQNALKKYFEDELGENSGQASTSLLISSIDPRSSLSAKFLAFDSVLNQEQVINVLNKLSGKLHPILIIYNKYRNVYFIYSRNTIDSSEEIKRYLDQVQEKILSENKDSSLIESSKNVRVLKCSDRKIKNFHYFSF